MADVQQGSGFILQVTQSSCTRLALFDMHEGRIDAIMFETKPLCLGGWVSYHAITDARGTRLQAIELLHAPLAIAAQNILFLHHVIELCFFSLPVGCQSSEVATLLALLNCHDGECSHVWQLLFLTRLVSALGLNDDHPLLSSVLLEQLFMFSIDKTLRVVIDLESQEILKSWLFRCVASHPMVDRFSTLRFLERVKVKL